MKHKHLIFPTLTLLFLGAACSKPANDQQPTTNQNSVLPNNNVPNTTNTGAIAGSWSFDGSTWTAGGTPPACPNPIAIASPVNVSLASAVLYPGQTRGGNYKAHGGFIFRGKQNADITVTAPLDGVVYNAVRYIESGETQYLFTFINPCGLAFRFDHLLTLSPAMQAIADTLPTAQVNNSATTMITTGASVKSGDTIATAVGFKNTNNVSVDFGLYDLRSTNGTTDGGAELGQHALCWLNNLSTTDAAAAKALPGGDGQMGKTSEYCH